MQNQFVQIKGLKILYQKKILTFTQTLNSNYGGHFKLSVWMVSKMVKHRICVPPREWARICTFFAYFLKCRYYSFYRFWQRFDWFNIEYMVTVRSLAPPTFNRMYNEFFLFFRIKSPIIWLNYFWTKNGLNIRTHFQKGGLFS